MFDLDDKKLKTENAKTRSKTSKKTNEYDLATTVMKAVASHVYDSNKIDKSFSREEIDEILLKREVGEDLSKPEQTALRKHFHRMKRWALEKEKTNNQQIICVPCIMDDKSFYKAYEISALYYAYRIADRLQRSAHVVADSDNFSKALNVVSIANMPKLIEQMKDLLNPKIDVTEDGIVIFTLKEPLTDEEIGDLRRVEQVRRDRLHNLLRPKAMDPATYNAILMVVRQVAPKVRKLDRQNYYMFGEQMLRDLDDLLTTYFSYADGLIDKKSAGMKLLGYTNRMFSGLGILAEINAWDFGASATIGENINEVKRLVKKDFGVKS